MIHRISCAKYLNQEERTVDTKKFKSVAVPVDTYKILQDLAEKEHRSVPMQITWIVEKEADKLTKKSA
jgi:hypothetical protein|tara:strand:+ start:310 stop:513 length:204 start_codon:yes stop_codon:yes gene_type:complete